VTRILAIVGIAGLVISASTAAAWWGLDTYLHVKAHNQACCAQPHDPMEVGR
jgi:hypothetical protein